MKKVLAFLDENLEEYIMAFLLGVISIVMMSQVIARYVFHHGFTWAEEVCRYCFVYSGLLSAAELEKRADSFEKEVYQLKHELIAQQLKTERKKKKTGTTEEQ